MMRTMFVLVATVAFAAPARAVDVAVSYLASAKTLRTLEATDTLDVAVFGDPSCDVPLAQESVEAQSVVPSSSAPSTSTRRIRV